MSYRISSQRQQFDQRTTKLRKASWVSNSNAQIPTDIRDLVFQCSLIQTSAATEEYIKSVFEGWAFRLKGLVEKSEAMPIRVRAAIAKDRLQPLFSGFIFNADEKNLLQKLETQEEVWSVLRGDGKIPVYFDGGVVFDSRKYPSEKNIKVLFARIGIDNPFDQMSRILKTDAELRLTGFNSIRTALAHSVPPQLTYLDVRREILNMQSIVRAFDRIIYSQLTRQCGVKAW